MGFSLSDLVETICMQCEERQEKYTVTDIMLPFPGVALGLNGKAVQDCRVVRADQTWMTAHGKPRPSIARCIDDAC